MKRVRIIYKGTVASAPLADKSAEMPNAEVLARLLNDVLNAPVQAGGSQEGIRCPRQQDDGAGS